ncbi:MAG: beta-galactosidase [Chloroflexota bacterium]
MSNTMGSRVLCAPPFDTSACARLYCPRRRRRDGTMYYGACYYPEHWPRERWATDAALMRAAGMNVVRLAEFAWALLQPREGVYDWAWLDEAIALLAEHGIDTVLGTPSATPPAWLELPPYGVAILARPVDG